MKMIRTGAAVLAGTVCWLETLEAAEFRGYPVRDAMQVVSLNGEWDFRLDGTNAWRKLKVPGNWETQGVLEPRYSHDVAEHVGLYRRAFAYDPAWEGSHVILRLDGALFGYTVRLNGQELGSATSAFNLHMFDMTPALLRGENVLEIEVSTRAKGWLWDTNDCWCLTGIMRDVEVFAVPDVHLGELAFSAVVKADGSADVTVRVRADAFAGASAAGTVVEAVLADQQRRHLASFSGVAPADGRLVFSAPVESPALWTAETPNLNFLTVTLRDAQGATLQRVVEKVGIRSVRTEGFRLLVNNRSVFLRGTCWNEVDPLHGRALTYQDFREQLTLMKKAHVNFIRTAHYPFAPRFLELCDEMGFYVCDEVPMGAAGRAGLSDPAMEGEISNRVWRTVMRDRNRPSVLLWSVSNESPFCPALSRALRYVKTLDPTRPKCVPQLGKDFAEKYVLDPDPEMDVLSGHYLGKGELYEKAMSRATRPVLQTEFGHACGNACTELEPCWRLISSNPKAIGAAVWCWRDQALLRPSGAANLTMRIDRSHYLDAYGIFGTDGIVYGNGYPKENFFLLRRLYAPITLAVAPVRLSPGGTDTLAISVSNRQDFLSTAGWRFLWKLQDAGRTLPCRGEFTADVPPHGCGAAAVAVRVPEIRRAVRPTLSLAAVDPHGETAWEASVPVALEGVTNDLTVAGASAARPPEGRDFLLRVGRRLSMIQIAQWESLGRDFCWQPHLLHPVVEGSDASGNRTTWRLRWNRDDVAETNEFVRGTVTVSSAADGRTRVAYELKPSADAKGIMLECGLALDLGADKTHADWLGRGPYSQVPGKTAYNDVGRWRLHKDDLRFNGNRAGVERMSVLGPDAGFAFWPEGGDFGLENADGRVVVSANAQVLPYCGKSSSVVPVQDPPLRDCTFRGAFDFAAVPGERTPPVAERPFLEDYGW